jgi:hypothetical protein
MRASIKITTTADEVTEVEAIVPDFIAWERRTKRRTSDLANGIGIEDLAYLAWSAMHREGTITTEFDAWLSRVAELEMVDKPAPKAGRKAV